MNYDILYFTAVNYSSTLEIEKNDSTISAKLIKRRYVSLNDLFQERFIFRNVQELESSLDEVKKAILRESKVTDKDIEKTKERIEELHRY